MYNLQKHEVSYEVAGQKINLDIETVRSFIAVGSNITNNEIIFFMEACKYQGMNPFTKDMYLVKFNDTVQMMTSINVMTQRLNEYDRLEGWNSGIIVINQETQKEEYKKGTFFNKKTEELVGAWFEAHMKGWKTSFMETINLDDYLKFNKFGKPQSQWASMPAVMIEKCAVAFGIRRILPGEFKGVYTADEIGNDLEKAIDITPVPVVQAKKAEPVKVEVKPEYIDIFAIREIVEGCKSNIVDIDADSLINYTLSKMGIESLDMLEKNKLSVFKKTLKNLIKLKEEKEKKSIKEEAKEDKEAPKDKTTEVNIVDVLEPVNDGESMFEEFVPEPKEKK
jgi:phage recombination protein Bet